MDLLMIILCFAKALPEAFDVDSDSINYQSPMMATEARAGKRGPYPKNDLAIY